MGFTFTNSEFNSVLEQLKQSFKVVAPKRFEKRGRFSDTDLIKYDEISLVEQIVIDEKSYLSPKEIIFPITQTLFHFTEKSYTEADSDAKNTIIFLRPCDINGIKRLDTIFLKNGNNEDSYYRKFREKVKFFMIECSSSFENCFCVSMNTNKSKDYNAAVRFTKDHVTVECKDESLLGILNKGKEIDFAPSFVTENDVKVSVPEVDQMPSKMYKHSMWDEFSARCISCGRCNTSCITCSCYSSTDIFYSDNENVGERRRVWSGCQIDGFTDMAGGHSFRITAGERMRFKTFHKVYDYKKRFGENMCVGCGRCDDVCPEYISFSNIINKVTENVEKEKKDV